MIDLSDNVSGFHRICHVECDVASDASLASLTNPYAESSFRDLSNVAQKKLSPIGPTHPSQLARPSTADQSNLFSHDSRDKRTPGHT